MHNIVPLVNLVTNVMPLLGDINVALYLGPNKLILPFFSKAFPPEEAIL